MEIKIVRAETLKPKPPAESLGFGRYFTDHMFEMEYTEGQGWHDPAIRPYGPLAMDPASMVLHYGQAVFEGLKCYRGTEGQLLLFRPEMNFKRLNVSNDRLCIPPLDEDFALRALMTLLTVERDWVPSAEGTSLYIRPFVLATEVGVGVHPSREYKFIIILSPVGPYYPEGINPVRIYVEDEYVRAVKGGIGFTKATANYAASLKGQEKAITMGYTQVLWLDGVQRKFIEEVGTMNVFFLIDGELITPKLEGSILPGVTRDSVLQLARHWGIPVAERAFSIVELYETHGAGHLQEAFGSGTAAVISPIGEFNWEGRIITVTEGRTGPLARRLYDALTGIQHKRLEDPFNWVKEVYSP
jgi:branched-chain amino acid aminotransferase